MPKGEPMRTSWKSWIQGLCLSLGLVVVLGFWPSGPAAAAGVNAGHARLASVAWLQQQLGRPDVVVLDASPASLHRQGHIPGAVNADLFTFGPRQVDRAAMEQRLRSWGLNDGQTLVIVDQGATYLATKLFWDLLHHGVPVERLKLLDGGMARWRELGGKVTATPTPPPAVGNLRLAAAVDEVRVRLPEFLAATADPQRHVLLEALEPEYYYGGAAFFSRGGHVPHATLMPASDFYNADKTFKSPQEIQRLLDHLGVRRDQLIHTYCGGGGAATVPFFALTFLLGYPRVTVFQESQLGWLQDARELPVWTYGAPALVHDTTWLKGWASPMLRAFDLARVSIVDVRPAEVFALGHMPLAVNLPAQTLRGHLDDPAALAALLGRVGLDATHEAVVVSDGGLNAQSALAFWQLERLGQRQVSIYLDSLERWAEQGHEVQRSKARPDVPAARPYPVALRSHTRLSNLQAAAGPMPRLFIASGERLPARLLPGPVVHLPHARLTTADGQPKPAKDLWALLAKAGVPRFAELVTVADDPGDAAVNYVLLRLMGFADVKLGLP